MFGKFILRTVKAAALLAALVLLPALAQTHGGHDHGGKVATTKNASHDHHGHHVLASGHVAHHAQADASQARQQAGAQDMRAMDVAAMPDTAEDNCVGGCCVAGHCAACVVAVIPPPFAAWPPVDHAAVVGYVAPALLSGGTRLLRRPPRHFV